MMNVEEVILLIGHGGLELGPNTTGLRSHGMQRVSRLLTGVGGVGGVGKHSSKSVSLLFGLLLLLVISDLVSQSSSTHRIHWRHILISCVALLQVLLRSVGHHLTNRTSIAIAASTSCESLTRWRKGQNRSQSTGYRVAFSRRWLLGLKMRWNGGSLGRQRLLLLGHVIAVSSSSGENHFRCCVFVMKGVRVTW